LRAVFKDCRVLQYGSDCGLDESVPDSSSLTG